MYHPSITSVADAYRRMTLAEDFPPGAPDDDEKKKKDAEAAAKPADDSTPVDSGKPEEGSEKSDDSTEEKPADTDGQPPKDGDEVPAAADSAEKPADGAEQPPEGEQQGGDQVPGAPVPDEQVPDWVPQDIPEDQVPSFLDAVATAHAAGEEHFEWNDHRYLIQEKEPAQSAENSNESFVPGETQMKGLIETCRNIKSIVESSPVSETKAPEAPGYYDHRRIADHHASAEFLHDLAHKALDAGDVDAYHKHLDAKQIHLTKAAEIAARQPKKTFESKVDGADASTHVSQTVPGPLEAKLAPRAAGEKRFVAQHTVTVVDGAANQGLDGSVGTTPAKHNKPEGHTVSSWVQEMADRISRGEPTAGIIAEARSDNLGHHIEQLSRFAHEASAQANKHNTPELHAFAAALHDHVHMMTSASETDAENKMSHLHHKYAMFHGKAAREQQPHSTVGGIAKRS